MTSDRRKTSGRIRVRLHAMVVFKCTQHGMPWKNLQAVVACWRGQVKLYILSGQTKETRQGRPHRLQKVFLVIYNLRHPKWIGNLLKNI